MSDKPLFQDSDHIEETYVGTPAPDEQPNVPPKMPSPALEHGTIVTPPLRGDADGIRSQPIDQGALGETELTESAKVTADEAQTEAELRQQRINDATNTDAG